MLAVVLWLGAGLSPRPKAICVRLPLLARPWRVESEELCGATCWLFLFPRRDSAREAGINENRREALLFSGGWLVLFFLPKLNDVRLDSFERRGSWASLAIGLVMLTGGLDRELLSGFSVLD